MSKSRSFQATLVSTPTWHSAVHQGRGNAPVTQHRAQFNHFSRAAGDYAADRGLPLAQPLTIERVLSQSFMGYAVKVVHFPCRE